MKGLSLWLLAVIVGVGAFVLSGYNKLVTTHQLVQSQWGQVETQFQRRFDLIPNLVRTAKGYMEHEKDIFEEIAKARQSYMLAKDPNAKMSAQGQVETALSRLIAIAENYPNVKASEPMQQLMDELAGTENRIAVERMRYNRMAAEYNMKVKRFPTNMTALLFGFSEERYLEATDGASKPPHVSFD